MPTTTMHLDTRTRKNRAAAFTLIELMITVAIVSILAAVALPAYQQHVIASRIPQATANLAGMRAKLEQFYQDNRTYAGACAPGTVAPLPAADAFSYSCTTLTDSAFVVQATGTGTMSGFTYTIDQSNNKRTTSVPSGWGTAPIACWVTKKGGAC